MFSFVACGTAVGVVSHRSTAGSPDQVTAAWQESNLDGAWETTGLTIKCYSSSNYGDSLDSETKRRYRRSSDGSIVGIVLGCLLGGAVFIALIVWQIMALIHDNCHEIECFNSPFCETFCSEGSTTQVQRINVDTQNEGDMRY